MALQAAGACRYCTTSACAHLLKAHNHRVADAALVHRHNLASLPKPATQTQQQQQLSTTHLLLYPVAPYGCQSMPPGKEAGGLLQPQIMHRQRHGLQPAALLPCRKPNTILQNDRTHQ